MNWLQKIAQQIEFNQTLNVLQKYINKLPGQWKMINVSQLDEEEMSIAYSGKNVKTHADEYNILVWFMYNPKQQPAYDQSIGHHSIRFGCLVLKVLALGQTVDIGFAQQELDTPKSVVDYAWTRIELDGWDGTEQKEKPVSPISPEYTKVHDPQLQLI